MQVTEQNRKTELPVAAWVALFVAGILIAAAGRFFGWRENPSHIWHEWAPLLTAVLAVFVCFYGYLRFSKGNEANNPAKKGTGLVICALGLTMVGASFLFRYAIPLLLS
jgi:hypothetical protein